MVANIKNQMIIKKTTFDIKQIRNDFPILRKKIINVENRKAFIGINNSNAILRPQYDLSRGNAGHPFYTNSKVLI